MDRSVDIRNLEIVKAFIAKLGKDCVNMTKIGKYVPLGISRIYRNLFAEHGQRGGGQWRQPGPWAKVLRARGRGKRVASLKEFEQIYMNPLEDTGILKMSFQPGQTGSYYTTTEKEVIGGSNLARAFIADTGGDSVFKFGEQEESRLEKNMLKVLPGSKPARTPTGRKSRAKKNWNKEFFIVRAAMRKADGKSYKNPVRKLSLGEKEIKEEEKELIAKLLERGLQEYIVSNQP